MSLRSTALVRAGVLFTLTATAQPATAQSTEASPEFTGVPPALERIVVTARRIDAASVGGSVTFLDAERLAEHSYSDINRVLRDVPGLNIVEEEGFGIRPSIGIRGSGTDRNTKIAVMEDGVPIAPAPYAAPAAYYFPRLPRMSAVVVTKGPGAIKYGPQTVAGALSMFSSPIPETTGGIGGRVELLGGDFETFRGYGLVGGYVQTGRAYDVGLSLETLQEGSDGFKELDSGGDTGFKIQDYVAKLALRPAAGSDAAQSMELKLQYSDEASDETYLGLTLDDFRADPLRRYRGSQLDEMNVEHWTYQATHRVDFTDRLDLTTIAYHTSTERAWYKLNDVRNAANTGFASLSAILENPATYPTEFAAILGEPGTSSAAGALRVRNNNREYYATGIQSVLGYAFDGLNASHQLEFSVRYHEDEEDRFQNDDRYQMAEGRMLLTSAGAPGTQDNRIGAARGLVAVPSRHHQLGPLHAHARAALRDDRPRAHELRHRRPGPQRRSGRGAQHRGRRAARHRRHLGSERRLPAGRRRSPRLRQPGARLRRGRGRVLELRGGRPLRAWCGLGRRDGVPGRLREPARHLHGVDGRQLRHRRPVRRRRGAGVRPRDDRSLRRRPRTRQRLVDPAVGRLHLDRGRIPDQLQQQLRGVGQRSRRATSCPTSRSTSSR